MENDLEFKDTTNLTDLKLVMIFIEWILVYFLKIGGVDISFSKKFKDYAISQYVVLSFPGLKVVYETHEFVKLDGPYIPGFLAFREAAHLVKLIKNQ
jgi:deoxyinosine 3'endonuclease (endonuclease V)